MSHHQILMMGYYAAREHAEQLRDSVAGVYGPFSEEWAEASQGMVTFKMWLIQLKGRMS